MSRAELVLVQADPDGVDQREQPEGREDEEERRDVGVRGGLRLEPEGALAPGATPPLPHPHGCGWGSVLRRRTLARAARGRSGGARRRCRARLRPRLQTTRQNGPGQPSWFLSVSFRVAHALSGETWFVSTDCERGADLVLDGAVVLAVDLGRRGGGDVAEDLADGGTAEVVVLGVGDQRERALVGREVADLVEDRGLLLGVGQPLDQVSGLLLVLALLRDRQVRAAPVAADAAGQGR